MSSFASIVRKKYDVFILSISILFAVVLRLLCRNFESEDFVKFLNEWVGFYRENGGFHALKDFDGDYNVLYQYVLILISYINFNCLYLIKLVSVAFDVLLAFGCAKCLAALGIDKQKQRLCFAVMILLPTILLNSALWAQCDSIYTSFVVFSIYFLIRKKNLTSISFLAIAFALKLQTIFVMPIYLVLLLNKEIKLREVLIFPVVIFLIYLPSMFFGKPITELVQVYITQTTEYPLMVMNAPSVFKWLGIYRYNAVLEKVSIGIAMVYTLAIVFIAWRKQKLDLLRLALLFAVGIPFLLPHMHERYFYLATVFALMCSFVYGKKYLSVLVCVEISSLLCYLHYFDFINRYAGRVISHLCSSPMSVILMLLAVVLTLLSLANGMGWKRYAACIGVSVLLALGVFSQTAQPNRWIWLDGRFVSFTTVEPYTDEQGNVMIPLRNFVNAMRGTLFYDDEIHRIVIECDDRTISLAVGSDVAEVNGEAVTMEKMFVPDGFSYLSHKDITLLTGLLYREKQGKVFFYTEER